MQRYAYMNDVVAAEGHAETSPLARMIAKTRPGME